MILSLLVKQSTDARFPINRFFIFDSELEFLVLATFQSSHNIPMLKERLEELQKNRRTILHTKQSLVKFIEDDEVDTNTLFHNITIETPFTTRKSLTFDRHTFSEKEERKFNKKFAPFLKGLLENMNNPEIDVLLEYLTRKYNIDTFNPKELCFLILPFEKYFTQLQTIAKNTKSEFSGLKSYSIPTISTVIMKNRKLFLEFVEYFKYYNIVGEFLDKIVTCMAEKLTYSNLDYFSEFYHIFTLLIAQNRKETALKMYEKLRKYLDAPEFQELFSTENS